MTIYLVLLADKWHDFWNVEIYGTYESLAYAKRAVDRLKEQGCKVFLREVEIDVTED